MLRGRLDVVEAFAGFVYLFTEAESSELPVNVVPDGVAAAVDGMLAVPVATDTDLLRVSDNVGLEVDGPSLGAGDEVLAVEVRCRGRDEASRAGVKGIEEPVEEIVIRLWPGQAPGGDAVTRSSAFARGLAPRPVSWTCACGWWARSRPRSLMRWPPSTAWSCLALLTL